MGDVLIATDGSEWAEAAQDRAIELAEQHRGRLHVLDVVDRREFSQAALSSSYLATIEVEDAGHDLVEEVAEKAREAGLEVETEVCHGVPAERIREYAEEIDAEAVVVAKHGDHRTHLGSVGRRLQRECDCEVVQVRPEQPA